MKKKIITIVASIGIFLLIVVGIGFQKYQKPIVIPYTSFAKLVEGHQVETVKLDGTAFLRFQVKGDKTFYKTDNPRIDSLKYNLLLNNIKVTEANRTSSVQFLQFLLSLTMVGGVFFIVFKNAKGRSGGMMALGTKPIEVEKLKVGFKEIAGNIEAKEQVEDIISFIKNPDKYTKLGARMPKGIIFYGPPGTGKTLMAKAIAKEAEVPFFSISGSDFVQLYVGVGASRVRELFMEARKHKKAVIFIDEIDAIGKKRSSNAQQSNDEKDQTLNALLTEMSGFKEEEGIVVVAATNRLDILDDALLRPGRFDRQVEIGYPDKASREQILKLYLKNKPVEESVNIDTIAKQTVYFTGAMLENLLNEAAILAANEEQEVIGKEHVEKAFYTVIAGAEKKDRTGISLQDKQITAFHEAGHALVTKLVAPQNKVQKVTIIPTARGAGGYSMNIPKDKMYQTRQDIKAQIKIALAGRAAEELLFGKESITTGASNDIEKATKLLKDYLFKYGMEEELGLIHMESILGREEIQNQELVSMCKEKMRILYEETITLLKENQSLLETFANTLLEKETLEEEEICTLLVENSFASVC